MRIGDFVRTSAFNQSVTIAAFFTSSALLVFAVIFWVTVGYASREVDDEVSQTAHAISSTTPFYVERRLKRWLQEETNIDRYGLLLDANGVKLGGNLDRLPDGVVFDGSTASFSIRNSEANPKREDADVRGIAKRLADGRALFVAVDTDEWEHFRNAILRVLALGLLPTIATGCLGGALIGRATMARLARMDASIGRIMQGNLSERLPYATGARSDELDQLASRVNLMLDDFQHLLQEVRVVGDSIAHNLRTPLTRMRTRLENGALSVRTAEDAQLLVEEATDWLDQTLGIITAVLRIGEIEHGQRRAAFRTFDAAALASEVFDLMQPLADEKGLVFGLNIEGEDLNIKGDRELLLEALVNLVDNAIKFTPRGGHCLLEIVRRSGDVIIRVQDSGPGIAEAERQSVLRSFYKAGVHQNVEGSGLGLALVAAIARLHNFKLVFRTSDPGVVVELQVAAG